MADVDGLQAKWTHFGAKPKPRRLPSLSQLTCLIQGPWAELFVILHGMTVLWPITPIYSIQRDIRDGQAVDDLGEREEGQVRIQDFA